MTSAGNGEPVEQSSEGMVAGRVTVGGQPQAEVTVMIVEGHADHPDIAALTNELGEYQLGGLQAGWYNLEARHGEQTARRSVELGAGEQARIDFSMS